MNDETGIKHFDIDNRNNFIIKKISDHDIRSCFVVKDMVREKYFLLKVFKRNQFQRETKRIEEEIKVIKKLESPLSINVTETCFSGTGRIDNHENFWIMYNFIPGLALNYSVTKESKKEPWFYCFTAWGIAQVVKELHSKNIIHRDIKPENIVIDDDGYPHLLDYGDVGKVDDDGVRRTQTGQHGSILYAPPESFTEDFYQKASDIYCLGGTIFYLVTREHPFFDLFSLNDSTKIQQISYVDESSWITFENSETREDWEIAVNNFISGKVTEGLRDPRYNPGTKNFNDLQEYQKMLMGLVRDCWEGECDKRPSIEEVIKRIEDAAKCLPTYYDIDMFYAYVMTYNENALKNKESFGSFKGTNDDVMNYPNLRELRTLFTSSMMSEQ